MNMSKRLIIILPLLLSALYADAQSVRLTPYKAPTALYLNVDRLFNYNLHEHARFELGTAWVLPNETAEHPKVFLGQWTLGGYVAYGLYDRAWKWGGSWSLRLPGTHDVRLGMSIKDDLEQAGSRRLENYSMIQTSLNTSYLASWFSRVQAVEGKIGWEFSPLWNATVGMRYSREQLLFGDSSTAHYAELKLRADYSNTQALTHSHTHTFTILLQPGLNWAYTGVCPYVRMLAQYAYGKPREGLHIWAQAGWLAGGTSGSIPESRLFDLSGTGGAPYFFEHTFLTIPPGTLVSDLFAHACIKYTAPQPLWETDFSKPKPFMQANLAVAQLSTPHSGLDPESQQGVHGSWLHKVADRSWLHKVADRSSLLLEPATGFDGIIRWGVLDMGFAVAYRLVNPKTIEQTDNPAIPIAIAVVANLIV